MKTTRTLLLLVTSAALLLALTGCRAGARRLNRTTDGGSQPAAVTAQPQATAQPASVTPQPALTQPAVDAQPTISGGDAELQDQLNQLEQIDKANQADDPLDDLPQ